MIVLQSSSSCEPQAGTIMVLSVFISQLSLLACLLTTASSSRNPRHGIQKRDAGTPQCLYSDYVYNETLDKCLQKRTEVQCGENMHFKFTGPGFQREGYCVCRNDIDRPCSARPQIRSEDNDRCWNLGQRGPCPRGQVLIPGDSDRVICGVDACKTKKPKNARKLSVWPECTDHRSKASRFKFIYQWECYRSETEAFCGAGEVVRFVYPSTAPACVKNTTCFLLETRVEVRYGRVARATSKNKLVRNAY